MKGRRIFLTAALVFAIGAAGAAAAHVFHFALSRSAPAADATVTPPAEVKLWFTQAPQDNSVRIRVLNGAGEPLATSEPVVDPENAMSVSVKPTAPLGAGSYTVSWRGVGDDGHVVTGDFGFSVRAEE